MNIFPQNNSPFSLIHKLPKIIFEFKFDFAKIFKFEAHPQKSTNMQNIFFYISSLIRLYIHTPFFKVVSLKRFRHYWIKHFHSVCTLILFALAKSMKWKSTQLPIVLNEWSVVIVLAKWNCPPSSSMRHDSVPIDPVRGMTQILKQGYIAHICRVCDSVNLRSTQKSKHAYSQNE